MMILVIKRQALSMLNLLKIEENEETLCQKRYMNMTVRQAYSRF